MIKNRRLPLGRLALAMAFMIFAGTGTLCRQALAGDELLDGFEQPGPVSADTLLDGFGDNDQTENENARDTLIDNSTPEHQSIRLGGHIKTAGAWNFSHDAPVRGDTDWQGVSSLKMELLMELEMKPGDKWFIFASGLAGYDGIYRIKGRKNYTDKVLDAYETRTQLRELYLQASPVKQLDIKIGRQIVVWGTSDYVRVVDILNPLDLRDPGTTDIEDLRLPVTMSKIDYYLGHFNLSGIVAHEVRFNETPPYGSAFYPYSQAPAHEEKPGSDLENNQLVLALKGTFSGWDFGLFWADLYHPDTHLETVSDDVTPIRVQKHERVNMFGTSSTLAKGNWLIKAESAYWDKLEYTNAPDVKFSRLDVMAGFEYSGFTDTQVTLELVNQHLFNYKKELKNDPDSVDENQLQSVICVTKDFMNEALTLTFLATGYGEKWQGGSYQRISAEYNIADSITVKGGIVFYQSGDLPMFKDIGGNDKIFFELKYSF